MYIRGHLIFVRIASLFHSFLFPEGRGVRTEEKRIEDKAKRDLRKKISPKRDGGSTHDGGPLISVLADAKANCVSSKGP